MQLTQPEIILILRKRANLTQAELGSKAFETTPNSGRTKIKNIELGLQLATGDDLNRIASCLDVPVELLDPKSDYNEIISGKWGGGILVSQKIVDRFMNLGNYIEMLNEAGELEDSELIEHLAKKIASILQIGSVVDVSPQNKLNSIIDGRPGGV